jgi:hypothetical protein
MLFLLVVGFLGRVLSLKLLVFVRVRFSCSCFVLVFCDCFVVVFSFHLGSVFVFRRSGWRAISLVLQSNISFFFFFCILLHEYYSCSTLRHRVQFGYQIKRSRLIVHCHEHFLLRLRLGCIPWHYSPSSIDPRYKRSTITQIFVNPLDSGNPTMKSIEMEVHGR